MADETLHDGQADEPEEELCWEIGRHGVDPVPGRVGGQAMPIDDASLTRYRRGESPPEEVERVEHALVADAEVRTRLIALADHSPPPPPARIADRLFPTAAPVAARRTARRWLPLAAALAFCAFLGVYLWSPAPRPVPDFQLSIHGDATTRGNEGEAVANPDTEVRIVVELGTGASNGFDYGLYRREGTRLVRFDSSAVVRRLSFRGAVEFRASARDLFPDARSRITRFWVVVAPPAALPAVVEPAESDKGDLTALLEKRSGGRAHSVDLKLTGEKE